MLIVIFCSLYFTNSNVPFISVLMRICCLFIKRMSVTDVTILFCVNVGKIYEIGSTGISSLGGHSNKRTECINRFVSEFGRMPLVSTTVKAVDSRGTWFW